MPIRTRPIRQHPPRLVWVWVCLLLSLAHLTQAQAPTTQPTSYKIERFSKTEPRKWEGFVVRIDLTDPKLQVRVGTGGPDPDGPGVWETRLKPTSTIAKNHDFDLAINCVFFDNDRDHTKSVVKYQVDDQAASTGLVMDDAKVLSTRLQGVPIIFDDQNHARIGPIKEIPKNARTIVSGNQVIVTQGKPVENLDDKDRHPRTCIGTTDDGKTLIILVIDGRRPGWSDGMTMRELAVAMSELGSTDALNLDGGGSTTLVTKQPAPSGAKYKVLNTPSDGSQAPIPLAIERPVPYALGFRWK